MAILADIANYVDYGDGSTTGYFAVAQYQTGAHAYAAGDLVRPLTAPAALSNYRVYVCTVAGTSGTEPAWTFTRGALQTTGSGAKFTECTGVAGLNGDLTNTPTWAQLKAVSTPTLGCVIQRNNGASLQICTTAGALGANEPAFSDTAGTTTVESTTTWTSLGAPSKYAAWAAPHATIGAAMTSTWQPFGYTYGTTTLSTSNGHGTTFVASEHAETQAASTTIGGTLSTTDVARILCVTKQATTPPASTDLTTGASVTTTGSSNTVTINPSGGAIYIYGITFKSGTSTGLASISISPVNATFLFDNCSFQLPNTSASSQINANTSSAGFVVWNNCTVKFADASQCVNTGTGSFTWQNGSASALVSGSTVPTGLLGVDANGRYSAVLLEALDLSSLSTSITANAVTVQMRQVIVKDCKLHASLSQLTPTNFGEFVQFITSDSSGTAYKSSRVNSFATESTETSITRVGGAQDPAGQAQSRKYVTNSANQFLNPFRAQQFETYNGTTGANVTVTIYGTINAGAIPNNDELWVDLEYLGVASFPQGKIITSAKANYLAASGTTGVNGSISSDTSTWNGGGSGAGWSPFKIQFLLNTTNNPQPQFAGMIQARVRLGKRSATYYIDPKIVLS